MSNQGKNFKAIDESTKGLPKLGYSIQEAKQITGLGRTTIWAAMDSGKLKFFRVGRRVLFSLEHLQEFLRSHEANSVSLSSARARPRAR